MIIIELNLEEKKLFEEFSKSGSFQYEIIESKKLGGDEIIFQLIITAIGIATPYIIDFFKSPKKDKGYITLIKDGIRIKFENEDELKKFLETNSAKND